MTEEELAAIEERAGSDVGPYGPGTSAGWQEENLYQYEKDIRALVAEVRRLRTQIASAANLLIDADWCQECAVGRSPGAIAIISEHCDPLEEWQQHVATIRGKAACGSDVAPFFVNKRHALSAVERNTRIQPCPLCLSALGIQSPNSRDK